MTITPNKEELTGSYMTVVVGILDGVTEEWHAHWSGIGGTLNQTAQLQTTLSCGKGRKMAEGNAKGVRDLDQGRG